MAAVLPESAAPAVRLPVAATAVAGAGQPGAPGAGGPWRRWLRWLLPAAMALLVLWPRPAWGLAAAAPPLAAPQQARGEQLFGQHCAGCHINGGNILRRGKTLKLAALERYGRADPAVIAGIAAAGVGQMGGYAAVLGEGGAEAVAGWVWQQAQAGWPRG